MSSIDDRNYWDKRNEEFEPLQKWNPEADGWTKEITQKRREEWNARVRAGEFSAAKPGQIDPLKLQKAQKAQGWTTISLKLAIKYHNL